MSTDFSVAVSQLDGTATVHIAGELDIATAPRLLVDLEHVIPPETVR